MKVLVDCRSIHPDAWGGIDTFANIVIEGLACQGIEIVIDASQPHKSWYQKYFSGFTNVSCISDPVQGWFTAGYASRQPLRTVVALVRRLAKLLGCDPLKRRARWAIEQKADVVYYPFHKDIPQHPHIPMVSTVHAVLPEYGPEEMRIIAAHAEQAKAVVVSWPHPYQDMARRFPSVVDHLFTIPITTKQNLKGGDDFDLTQLGVAGEYLFFPAVLSRRKNHENLIRAYGIAHQEGIYIPPAVFCGGGDTDLRKRLEDLVEQLGVGEKIKFLGYVSRDTIAALYKNCLGTVAPTLWEAGMATLQEGAYCGKPAACSDIEPARAHAELLEMEVCFFNPKDPADIAVKLREFVTNIDRYRNSAVEVSEKVRSLDEHYLGRCYGEVLSFASGLGPKPEWMPFLKPRSWS